MLAVAVILPACATEVSGDDEAALEDLESYGSPRPVIFVHGCQSPDGTDAQAAAYFDLMKAYFAQRGYPSSRLVSFVNGEEQCTSNKRFADQLDDLIDSTLRSTGADKVDIVAHSMGALAARYYLVTEGTWKVDDFVSIAGANHGTDGGVIGTDGLYLQDLFGGYPWFEGFQEMYPPYACKGQTFGGSFDVQYYDNGCLTPSGRTVWRDETPGSVRYLSIRNTQDEIIHPVESSCLNQRYQNDCSDTWVNKSVSVPPGPGPNDCAAGCPAHLTVLFSQSVIATTYNFVKPSY